LTSATLRRALLGAFVVGLGFSITLSETALALLTLHLLWSLQDPKARRFAVWPLAGPILAFAGCTIFSALVSNHPAESLAASKGLLLIAALYVVANSCRNAHEADRLLTGLVVVGGLAALVGLAQVGICPGQEEAGLRPAWLFHRCYRARGFFSIYMTLAGVLNLILLASVSRWFFRVGTRVWVPVAWLIMLGGLVATSVRGAWIGFAAGLGVLLPTSRRGWIFLVAGIGAFVALLLLGPRDLSYRVRSIADPEEAGIKERLYMWKSGAAMWKERPIMGWGPGGVKREYERFALPEAYKKRTGHVHNTPLQILVERGVLGLAAWLSIWIGFYAHAVELLRRLAAERIRERALVTGSLAAVTGFLVAGLSEYNFGDSEVVMLAWAIVALPYVVARGEDLLGQTVSPDKRGSMDHISSIDGSVPGTTGAGPHL
jgi:O-antigen ligase